MSASAERLKARHRGSHAAEAKSIAALSLLRRAGLSFSFEGDDRVCVVIEGCVLFNLATSTWRADDGTTGYLIPGVIQYLASTKPATGRDSAATELTSGKSRPAVAESVTGPSSELLPVVEL